jgi:hypothetical protein
VVEKQSQKHAQSQPIIPTWLKSQPFFVRTPKSEQKSLESINPQTFSQKTRLKNLPKITMFHGPITMKSP